MLTTLTTSVTAYFGLSGGLDISQTTETNAQVTVNSTFQFSQLTINITSNSITSATSLTVNLRANSGNTGVAVSASNAQTGVLSDSTDTYTAAITYTMNYQIVTGSTGTLLKISFISVCGNATPALGGGGPSYQHFRNTTKPIGRQDYNSFGGQMVVFG